MEHWRRMGLVVYSLGWFVLAISFWNLREADAAYGAYFWPFWYLATAVVTLSFAIKPKSFRLYSLSGGMGVVGLLSRVAALYVGFATDRGYILLGWQLPVGLVVYTMAASGLWYWWRHAIFPWHKSKKDGSC